jgi:hypothetical protein
MDRRKSLSDDEQLEILFNDDSGDELIPELDFSDSDSNCGNENGETLVHDGAEVSESESAPDTSPIYCPILSMQTVASNCLQSHELPTSLSRISSASPALSDTSIHASTSSAHSTYQGAPKRAPAKDPPSRLDGRRNEHIVACTPLIRRVLVRMIGFIIRWLHTHS